MFKVAGAIKALADSFLKPSSSANLTSPQQCGAAIHILKEDGDLSDNKQVAAIWLFSHKTLVADSYLSIKKKSTHTLFIQFKIGDNQSLWLYSYLYPVHAPKYFTPHYGR